MAVKMVEVTRGGIVESEHYGHVVVANSKGELIAYAGDPETVTFMRSAAKPLQALNVILSGAADKYHFTSKELAIMCASHYGEDFHLETIEGMLDKLDCQKTDLLCGSPYSIKESHKYKQLSEHMEITPMNSDCSGKHCGFISVCKTKGYEISDYDNPDHPMQKEVSAILGEMCDYDPEKFAIGIDGCGVPVHGFPMRNMAIGYAKLANPEFAPEKYQEGCVRVFQAMNEAPEMISGTDGFCSEFLKNTHGKFCGKVGAEAIYCIGVKGKDMGIIVKIADGSMRALNCCVMHTLKALGLLTPEEEADLRVFVEPEILSVAGKTVGTIRPVFELTFV